MFHTSTRVQLHLVSSLQMVPRWTRPLLHRFASSQGSSDSEIELARKWLQKLDSKTIPRHLCDLSFSRSSGPGGQNVNKVSSKATLKISLASLFPLVPSLLHSKILASRYTADRSQSLVIQSDETRVQSTNVDLCFKKLYELLESSGNGVIPGETSQEQKDRVHKLQRAQNESRIKAKKLHSNKKSNRRGNKYDD